MFARGPSWLRLPTRCRRHREPSRRLAAPGTLPSRSLPEIGHLSRRPAVWLFLRIVADVFTCGIIRASQEAAVLTDLCLQPAVAVGATLDGQTAVAAAEGAVCLDRQSLSANRAWSLRVPAIGPVRAAVEDAPVPLALASLEPSLNAYRAGDVAIRRPAEDGDVVSPVDQFHGKGRSRTALGKQEDAASGAGIVTLSALISIW